ncbi:hypothetical protein MMC07_001178 [Pseudocyphellaria aurata]|nr:hypothetical protein [Pseudocyphellaria aurata]
MPSTLGPKIDRHGVNNLTADVKVFTRDRPWLLPSNRKLRHLRGISLRNLTLSRPPSRSRGKTTDDESLPNAFISPTKLFALRESNRLEHSRSSNDLKSPSKPNGLSKEEPDPESPAEFRPSIRNLRRRSTLNWSNALPSIRQKKLEDVTGGRMADSWFSLHCADISEPVHVSEVVDKAMNPSFRFFDLNTYGPSITRRDELTLKFWARTQNMEDYILLIELQLHLRSLHFIGKTLESFHHPLPQNCIIFHLPDGIYTSFTDLPWDESALIPAKNSKPHLQGAQPTSSFDALMRLSNLDDCIQDALSTREKLATHIKHLLSEQQQTFETINAASQARENLAATQRALLTSRKALISAQTRRDDFQAGLQARRATIESGTLSQEKAQSHLATARMELSSCAFLHQNMAEEVAGQIRRICEDVLSIYPIDPVSQKPLLFTIRKIPLPNATSPSSSSSESDPAATAAALSLVAHVVHLLSFYLSTPVPYPPTIHGSTSSILDPISTTLHSLPARTFPLYQKGAVPFRFEYAVFLLNTDIELLMSRQGLRMVDQRHTLPNLKYLLYVLTAGKGELPMRKRGDVRGLGKEELIGQRTEGDETAVDGRNGSLRKGNYAVLDKKKEGEGQG